MILDKIQTDNIKLWVADGATIGDVQKRIKDDYGIPMTYMDVRFLIDDLGAELVRTPDAPSNEESQLDAQADSAQQQDAGFSDDSSNADDSDGYCGRQPYETAEDAEMYGAQQPTEDANQSAGGNVDVSISPIQRPDCIVSGDVVFSDGTKAEWRVDRMGQLGLIPEAGKNPPQADMYVFQRKLQEMLSRL